MATPTYDLLDSVTLSSSASSVTFSSIDQSYRDLVLVGEVYKDSGSAFAYTIGYLNGDTANNYTSVWMRGDGSSASSSTGTDYIRFTTIAVNSTSPNFFVAQFLDYSATDKHKTILSRGNSRGTSYTEAIANRWANTSAITQIQLFNFSTYEYGAGTKLYLYGVAA